MTSPIDSFYPTPKNLIDKMLSGVALNTVKTVLEPSAGKGDIVDVVAKRMETANSRGQWMNGKYIPDIDTIEINPDLRHVLTGKEKLK